MLKTCTEQTGALCIDAAVCSAGDDVPVSLSVILIVSLSLPPSLPSPLPPSPCSVAHLILLYSVTYIFSFFLPLNSPLVFVCSLRAGSHDHISADAVPQLSDWSIQHKSNDSNLSFIK